MNITVFLTLLRAGLWEQDLRVSESGDIDYSEIYRIAEEQAVVGLLTAGLEHVVGIKVPKEEVLHFVGSALLLEQRNTAMNEFVASLIERLRKEDVYAILVKGQGIAQCYERPLWRACGDVDLLLSDGNYKAAKEVLTPIAEEVSDENTATKHQAYKINSFDVELHGRMPFGLSRRVDKVIDEAQRDVFFGGSVRSWTNGNTFVFLPSPDNDVIFVFTHFLHHFFIEGVGLRQICDWCRLLWTYRSSIDMKLLENRIKKLGLMTEWKVFGTLAVEYLGMPVEAMPFYDAGYKAKAERVLRRILECGNFGHNKDLSYRIKYTGMTYKVLATWRRFCDFVSLIPVFPLDAPRFFVRYMFNKV